MTPHRAPSPQRDWVLLNSDPEPSETFLAILLACIAIALLTTPTSTIQSAISIVRDSTGDGGLYAVTGLLLVAAVTQFVAIRLRWISVRIVVAAFEVIVSGWMAATNLASQAGLGLSVSTMFFGAYLVKSAWVVWRLNRPGVR